MVIEYEIKEFDWDVDRKILSGHSKHIWNYSLNHTSMRKQFFIKNSKTEEFRRFRFIKQDCQILIFRSEDGITCEIYLDEEPESIIYDRDIMHSINTYLEALNANISYLERPVKTETEIMTKSNLNLFQWLREKIRQMSPPSLFYTRMERKLERISSRQQMEE